MKLSTDQIAWIVDEYTLCDRTVEEISLDTGKSKATIKRALAEAGILNLSWHKSEEQHKMLSYLNYLNVNNVEELQAKLAKEKVA